MAVRWVTGESLRRQVVRALLGGLLCSLLGVDIEHATAVPTTGHHNAADAAARPSPGDSARAKAIAPLRQHRTRTRPPVRYVAVSVATVWTTPGRKRPVDAPALSNPAHPRRWVADMTVHQKRRLSAMAAVQTQALYATKVYILGRSGAWRKIAVASQSTPKNKLGYPGWVPRRQLTTTAPARTKRFAVVRRPTAWLRSDWDRGGATGKRIMELSYDTRLPVVKMTSNYVKVVALDGSRRALHRPAVVVHTARTAWTPTGADIVSDGRQFLGLQYLWGGASGFSYDCSGFTHALYHRVGIKIPRDASAQATLGARVSLSRVRRGDLLFVTGASGSIGHVVMYAGKVDGRRSVIEAPGTGLGVRVVARSTYTYQVARRYLTG